MDSRYLANDEVEVPVLMVLAALAGIAVGYLLGRLLWCIL